MDDLLLNLSLLPVATVLPPGLTVFRSDAVYPNVKDSAQASEQLFRSIFENTQIGISLFKIDDQESVTNRALQEMLGHSEEELSRIEQWDEIVAPEERASGGGTICRAH